MQLLVLWGLVFWIILEVKACCNFMDKVCALKNTAQPEQLWSEDILKEKEKETAIPKDHLMYLDRYVQFDIVSRLTGCISHMIYLPLGMILAILIGRSRIFDQFAIPWSLLIIFSISVIYLLIAMYELRRSAENLRSQFLDEYEYQSMKNKFSGEKAGEIQIGHLIDLIRRKRNGIYATLSHQPALTALLIPFGGMSGVQILEYVFNI